MSDQTGSRKCVEFVYRDHWRSGQCTRNGVIERDGKMYCRQHDPVRIQERREEEDRKFREDIERRRQAHIRTQWQPIETAPIGRERKFLGYDLGSKVYAVCFKEKESGLLLTTWSHYNFHPTHWHPLPDLPEGR